MFTLKEKLERKVSKMPMTWSECTPKNNPQLPAETVKELQDKADAAQVGQRAEVKKQRMEEFERSKQEPKARGRPSALKNTHKGSDSKSKAKAKSKKPAPSEEGNELDSEEEDSVSPSPEAPSDQDGEDNTDETEIGVKEKAMLEKRAAAPATKGATKVDTKKLKPAAALIMMAGNVAGSKAKEKEEKDGKKAQRSSASRPKSEKKEGPPATAKDSIPAPAKKKKAKISEK